MRKLISILAASAAVLAAVPAMAAPTITSASVTGPTGTVWDTTVNNFYTLFISRPYGNTLNPNDNFSGAAVDNADPIDGGFAYTLAGDGFPTGGSRPFPNSDPFYTLTLTVQEGAASGTLSGVYDPTTGVFVASTGPLTLSSGKYSLTDFDWSRGTSNIVGSYSTSATSTQFPGARADYQGSFTLNSTSVPEPATWGLMILGFGAVGGALRTRRKTVLAVA